MIFDPIIKNFLNFCKLFQDSILAVTATATETVVNDIINVLTLKEPLVVSANFDRPNLYIKCVDVKYANWNFLVIFCVQLLTNINLTFKENVYYVRRIKIILDTLEKSLI